MEKLLIIGILLFILAIIIYYLYQNTNSSSSKKNISSDWDYFKPGILHDTIYFQITDIYGEKAQYMILV